MIPLNPDSEVPIGAQFSGSVTSAVNLKKELSKCSFLLFSIGAFSVVAIVASNVVLMKSRLIDVPAAVRLSRATLTNIHENLFWAFFYNVIGIPLAAGLWYPLLGWKLNPMFGAAAMSLSSFCVVTNALRLNLCRLYDPKHDR